MASTGTIVAVAAQERTSQGQTSTTRSARSSATCTASVSRRGRSQTTVTAPRRPASMSAPTAPQSNSWPRRVPDSRLIPRCRGRPSRTADQANRPPCKDRSGQRRPGRFSQPISRSIPPPQGSRSTSRASAALWARAAANNETPAPPLPPMTAITWPTSPPRPSSRAASTASASSRINSPSCSGICNTAPAPIATAVAQVSVPASAPVSRQTWARRGKVAWLKPRAAAGSSTTAPAADHAFRVTGLRPSPWTIRTPTAAATRSSSSRSFGSTSIANTPALSVAG